MSKTIEQEIAEIDQQINQLTQKKKELMNLWRFSKKFRVRFVTDTVLSYLDIWPDQLPTDPTHPTPEHVEALLAVSGKPTSVLQDWSLEDDGQWIVTEVKDEE